MPIKARHTVKAGDRISRIAANYQVSAQEIIDATPSVFTPARIAETNKLIGAGTIPPGEVLIYAGEILNIPTGFVDSLSDQQTIRVDSKDELTILIDRTRCPEPHAFEFIEYFDACSDSFSITYPNDPNLQNAAYQINPEEFKTKGLPDIRLYIGEDPVLAGKIEVPANQITPSASTQTLGGRSKTYLLEKSDMLPSIRREFIDLNLKEIAEEVCSAYGIQVEVEEAVDLGENFSKATAEDNEKPFVFISRLARERAAICSVSGEGKFLIRKAVDSDPVANFDIDAPFLKFLGVNSLEFVFDTRTIFGNYIGKGQTPDDQSLTETVQSRVLAEQSVKITDYSDANGLTLRSMTEWEEQKAVREFYKNEIPFPDWINPNTGSRWRTGQIITIKSAEAGIPEPRRLLIRQINFTKNTGDKLVATLGLIPAEVYL